MSTAATRPVPQVPPRPTRNHGYQPKQEELSHGGDPASDMLDTNRPDLAAHGGSSLDPSDHNTIFMRTPSRQDISRPGQNYKFANPIRFAQSPLNDDELFCSVAVRDPDLPLSRPHNTSLPSLGEEGAEYAAVMDDPNDEEKTPSQHTEQHDVAPVEHIVSQAEPIVAPEQTHTVDDATEMYAPKPKLPVSSAHQRVQIVTRTDSHTAASFGIGQSRTEDEDELQFQKIVSTRSEMSGHESHGEDEQGIPEIGQQVPMLPGAGDVQAPSPAASVVHNQDNRPVPLIRRIYSRGPPGSYGQHGHGVVSVDKLDQAYYEKYPDRLHKEHAVLLHDRQGDYTMSRENLDKIVRETDGLGSGPTSSESREAPSEDVGFQAHEEYYSCISSANPHTKDERTRLSIQDAAGPSASASTLPAVSTQIPEQQTSLFTLQDDDHPDSDARGSKLYEIPIIAPDEAIKGSRHNLMPAVIPALERTGSVFEIEEPSRSISRQTDRSGSIYNSLPLEDIPTFEQKEEEEYEPLITQQSGNEDNTYNAPPDTKNSRHLFPSKDVWEDAPSSTFVTAEVSTPEVEEAERKKTVQETESLRPAHMLAQEQREDVETGPRKTEDSIYSLDGTWSVHAPEQEDVVAQNPQRPTIGHSFPSRDVWEDVPDSHVYETTVSERQAVAELPFDAQVETPVFVQKTSSDKPSAERPAVPDRPAVPERPKPKSLGDDKTKLRPKSTATGDVHKPQIPTRPIRPASATSHSLESQAGSPGDAPKAIIPQRPLGSKIAALQAGFMSDLNRRLQLGQQALPKREDPAPVAPEIKGEANESLLVDARKGRARGPKRRAATRGSLSPGPAATDIAVGPLPPPTPEDETKARHPTLTFSLPTGLWLIDPHEGALVVGTIPCHAEAPPALFENPQRVVSEHLEEEPAHQPPLLDPVDHPASPADTVEPEPPDQEDRDDGSAIDGSTSSPSVAHFIQSEAIQVTAQEQRPSH